MTTALYQHGAFRRHVTPPGHPEQVARLGAVEAGLAGLMLDRREAPVAADFEVLHCHPAAYLARVRAAEPESQAGLLRERLHGVQVRLAERSADALYFGRVGVPLYVVYPKSGGEPVILPQLLTEGMVIEAIEKAGV